LLKIITRQRSWWGSNPRPYTYIRRRHHHRQWSQTLSTSSSWSKGVQPSGAVLHSSREPRELTSVASPSKDLVSGTVYPLSWALQTFHRLCSETNWKLICFSAFAAPFLVALRLAKYV